MVILINSINKEKEMSTFIPKKTLTEGMAANPLDHQVSNDQDVTKLAQEGILTAIAAETDAINQYTQILDLVFQSESWLKEKATPVLEDIIAEEKKHLAQLTELVSTLPAFEKEMEEGEQETKTGKDVSEEPTEEKSEEEEKEEVDESAPTFDLASTLKIITEEYPTASSFWSTDEIDSTKESVEAEYIDNLLEAVEMDTETLDKIEKRIVSEAIINK